jgi:hypothetical protein
MRPSEWVDQIYTGVCRLPPSFFSDPTPALPVGYVGRICFP